MHTILTILWRDDRDYGVHYVAKSQLVEKWKTRNRDRGKPRGSSPPTPPYMRVRIRRFRDLSRGRPEVRVAFRRWKLRRSQVPFGLHPIRPWQAPPKRIGWRLASMRAAHYYSRSRFGPSSVAGLIRPLLTSAARSRHLAMPSVTIP